jgi:D-alanyl-D-alanine dipeptidase
MKQQSVKKSLTVLLIALAIMAGVIAGPIPGLAQLTTAKPAPAPAKWIPLIGEYVRDKETVIILESDGKLCASFNRKALLPLREVTADSFEFDNSGSQTGEHIQFLRDGGRVTQVAFGKLLYQRKPLGPEEGAGQLKVQPVRPVPDLIKEALKAQPPNEPGDFRPTDLVELTKLDPTIKLDIRYATRNNLFDTVFYSQARAFLQRPAAEALVRVNQKLKASGYGLLVHDGYRPWYVTKVFWDASPDDKKLFVADPSKGSRHNRGCAVDLSLYDLKTGKPIEMVSTYDETTDRAFPNYPGGTSLERWHRDFLRAAMESEGFTVYEAEWWHFDYKDWQKYRIGNVRFEAIGSTGVSPASYGQAAGAKLSLQ